MEVPAWLRDEFGVEVGVGVDLTQTEDVVVLGRAIYHAEDGHAMGTAQEGLAATMYSLHVPAMRKRQRTSTSTSTSSARANDGQPDFAYATWQVLGHLVISSEPTVFRGLDETKLDSQAEYCFLNAAWTDPNRMLVRYEDASVTYISSFDLSDHLDLLYDRLLIAHKTGPNRDATVSRNAQLKVKKPRVSDRMQRREPVSSSDAFNNVDGPLFGRAIWNKNKAWQPYYSNGKTWQSSNRIPADEAYEFELETLFKYDRLSISIAGDAAVFVFPISVHDYQRHVDIFTQPKAPLRHVTTSTYILQTTYLDYRPDEEPGPDVGDDGESDKHEASDHGEPSDDHEPSDESEPLQRSADDVPPIGKGEKETQTDGPASEQSPDTMVGELKGGSASPGDLDDLKEDDHVQFGDDERPADGDSTSKVDGMDVGRPEEQDVPKAEVVEDERSSLHAGPPLTSEVTVETVDYNDTPQTDEVNSTSTLRAEDPVSNKQTTPPPADEVPVDELSNETESERWQAAQLAECARVNALFTQFINESSMQSEDA